LVSPTLNGNGWLKRFCVGDARATAVRESIGRLKMKILLIALLTSPLFCGCEKLTVEIDKSFTAEVIAQPSYDAWERHADELLYLVQKGDKDAIAAAIRVIPKVLKSDVVTNVEWLASALYEQIDIEDIAVLSVEDQARLIRLYDRLQLVDWKEIRNAYVAKRPEVRQLLED
jgi:hypothetical protein